MEGLCALTLTLNDDPVCLEKDGRSRCACVHVWDGFRCLSSCLSPVLERREGYGEEGDEGWC